MKSQRPQRAWRQRRDTGKSLEDLVAAAQAVVRKITADEARQKIDGAVVVAVCDAADVEKSGGAVEKI